MLQKRKKYSAFNRSNFKFYFNLLIEISSNCILKFAIGFPKYQFLIKSKLFRNRLKHYFDINQCAETFSPSILVLLIFFAEAFSIQNILKVYYCFHAFLFVSSSLLSVSNQPINTSIYGLNKRDFVTGNPGVKSINQNKI